MVDKEHRAVKPIKREDLHLPLFDEESTKQISSQVFGCGVKLVTPSRTAYQIKGEEMLVTFSIWEVHCGHVCMNRQRHMHVCACHHVVWPVWCACNKQVQSVMSCIHRVPVTDITQQVILLALFNRHLTIQPCTETEEYPLLQQHAQEQ